MDVRATIIDEMRRVAREQKKTLASLDDEASLLDSGLDSLCFAILVARLEEEIGVDPFSSAEDVELPVTVGELIEFYENALV